MVNEEVKTLSKIAKREVVETSPFAKLIKTGLCKVESKTTGDTLHTVQGMKPFVYKHLQQTTDLAKALFKDNLKETIANNYKFLYSHFQYDADGFTQVMRSPECAFADRFTGIDCKTYSMFASSLLLNQGIKHFIRRIKQGSFNAEHWTHVYVVIPIDQDKMNLSKGYYVIDGTLHNNTETPFIKKHDTEMSKLPHVWLNGPGLNNSFKASNIVLEGFQELLKLLLSVGVSSSKIQTIANTINRFLKQGIDPYFKITNSGITIQGVYIPYVDSNLQFRQSKKLGSAISYANNFSENPVKNRFNSGLNGEEDGLSEEQIEGLDQVLNEALDSNFFNNTFGSVFSNGMDFSCWNSTFTPQQTSQQVNEVHIPKMRELFNTVVNANSEIALQNALNALDKYTANANKFFWHERIDTDWQQCSRKALDIYTEYYREQYPKIATVVQALQSSFNITSSVLGATTTIPPVYDHNSGPVGVPYQYKSYLVSVKSGVLPNNTVISNPFDNEVVNPDNSNGLDSQIIDNAPEVQQAGFSPLLGLVLIGGAIGTYYLSTKKNKKQTA